ncbi:MAG: diguanylate cyclase [Burkholderiaceae bacterium]|jgi:diguanylate cyclase (GGDEF)-like protein/PAS domain S-box-containing protein|nr:diguanylate cyclase [Burkholderiaceae bacterium]
MRHHLRITPLSLRNRLTISVVLIALISTLGVVGAAFYYIRTSALEDLARDQMQRTVAIADAIDQKFITRRALLKTFANSLVNLQLHGTAQLQPFLRGQPALLEFFENVAVFNRSGVAVASFHDPGSIGQLNVSDRTYFIETLATGQGVISQPIRNRVRGMPQVVMTEPVHDAQGQLVYVVNALISLDQPDFLGELADLKFGKTGYVFITNTHGIVIDSPRKSRILKHFDAEGGHNEATTRAVAGFEGTTEGVNRLGVSVLYAFKQTRQTNWIIGTHYPRAEAVAALQRVEHFTWLGALALSLLVGGLSLYLLRRELAPLDHLRLHMLANHAADHYVPLSTHYEQDELGDLARTFDRLMAERHQAQQRLSASETYLREVLRHAGDAFIALDRTGRITEWNHQAERVFGYARDEVLGQPLAPLIIPETMRAAHNNGMQQFTQQGTGPMVDKRMEVEALHRTGQRIPIEISLSAMDRGDHFVAHAFLRDISERKAAERALALSEAKLRGVTDNLPALVSHMDTQERFTFVNSAVREWWGMEPDALLGRTMREVVGETVYPIAQAPLKRALAGERVEFDVQRQIHGEMRDVHNIYVPDMDSEGTTRGVFTLSINITELKTVERKLALLARVDPLTQLANRLAFSESLPQILARARRSGTALALMYLDIDHFKAINDSLGHAAGDEVLEEFARRLQAGVRSTDTVARLAGDEFVAVLENVAETSVAADVAQKIVDQVARPLFLVGGQPLHITTSIGIVFYVPAEPPTTPVELMARADAALYRAKAAGRNQFQF